VSVIDDWAHTVSAVRQANSNSDMIYFLIIFYIINYIVFFTINSENAFLLYKISRKDTYFYSNLQGKRKIFIKTLGNLTFYI